MSAVLELEQVAVRQNNGAANGVKLHRFTVKVYDEMIKHGILTTNDKVELLNGEILEKMPKGEIHASINDWIGEFLRERLGKKVIVRYQNPIILDDFSEPEPDLVLAKPPRETYFKGHPKSEDIFLIVEISDSTLSFDRNAKADAYARAGIIQYLIVNVQNSTVEDYREPGADGFQSKQTLRGGQTFNLVAFPKTKIKVDNFLSPEK